MPTLAPGWNSVQSVNMFQKPVGGSLAGGDPGVRLIEPPTRQSAAPDRPRDAISASSSGISDASDIPKTSIGSPPPADGLIDLVPLYHIFGSEELSARSPAVSSLAPKPHLFLHPADAARLGITKGDSLALEVTGDTFTLPAEVGEEICQGVVGVPVGLPGVENIVLPARGTVKKVSKP